MVDECMTSYTLILTRCILFPRPVLMTFVYVHVFFLCLLTVGYVIVLCVDIKVDIWLCLIVNDVSKSQNDYITLVLLLLFSLSERSNTTNILLLCQCVLACLCVVFMPIALISDVAHCVKAGNEEKELQKVTMGFCWPT